MNGAAGTTRTPADRFDPAHYAAVRKPLLEAETVPVCAYTSEAFYKREIERIFMKVWNFLGRVEQVARPGDYFAAPFPDPLSSRPHHLFIDAYA